MEETKKWWQSRTIQSVLALVAGSVAFLLASFGVVSQEQLSQASTVYPEVQNGIALIQGGQLFAGFSIIVGALVVYFRTTAKKLIG
jgi:hypothetical protein